MMKKLIALVLSLAMVFSLVACGGTEAPKEDVAILYTNDVHTYIDGTISYDVIAALKEELKAQYKNVLLVDAGDHSQGLRFYGLWRNNHQTDERFRLRPCYTG